MKLREYDERTDRNGLRECLIELQDSERNIDARIPPGADIVSEYIPKMLARCDACKGTVLVLETEGKIAGYATILTQVTSDEIHDGDIEYGLISDLMVREPFRGQGHGRRLLEAAESFARAHDVHWLRIGVLAANQSAYEIYKVAGYSNLYIELEKDLTDIGE